MRKLGLTSSYSRPLLLNMVLVATKYPNQKRNDLAHKVMPTLPTSVLNNCRAVSSRTMIPGNPSISYSSTSQQAKIVLNTLIGPQLQESPTADQGYVRFPNDLEHAHEVERKNSRPWGRSSPWKNMGNSFPIIPASGRRRSIARGNRCSNWMMAFAHSTIPPWER